MTSTNGPTTFETAVQRLGSGSTLARETEALLQELTPEERLWLLDGDTDFWTGMAEMAQGYNLKPIVMGQIDRLGIPGLRFSDGPRGVVMGRSTAFPVSMARGATWDVELEERVGLAIGREMRAQGANFFGGVCINLPRHPAWGRAQETYSEDPILLGAFGAALVRGIRPNAMAVAKHYALNSMENARFTVDVQIDDAALHEVFLPHFRQVVEEGVHGIMTSYNSVNGEWAGQNEVLLEDILRVEWGFTGITVTDFVSGFRDTVKSLRAGLDVEAPVRQQRAQHLPKALADGAITWDLVDRAARRILSTQLAFHASDLEEAPPASIVFSAQHRKLAREVAGTSMVLLQNEPVDHAPLLPLDPSTTGSIALIGRLADLPNIGDDGSSSVHSPEIITALRGLSETLPTVDIRPMLEDDATAAARAAAESDIAIVMVGYTAEDEGEYIGGDAMMSPELLKLWPPLPDGGDVSQIGGGAGAMTGNAGGDRASLRLRPVDEEIIRSTVAANPRTIVVIVTAGAVITESWRHEVPALLIGWYSGTEGGRALGDVLTGKIDASGRLPYSIPVTEAHLPFFDRDATSITYDRWVGQRLLDRDGHAAAFPLGFGLSYTSFTIDGLDVVRRGEELIEASVVVKNTGSFSGRHVVQLYGVVDADDFPHRVLLGFAPVTVAVGGAATVTVRGSLRPLQRWVDGAFRPAGEVATIEAAAWSGDPGAATASLPLS